MYDEDRSIDNKIKEKELEKLQSEIDRNKADIKRMQLGHRKTLWNYVFAFIVVFFLVGVSFSGFVADLYSIAVVDRHQKDIVIQDLKAQNESLTKNNASLKIKSDASANLKHRLDLALATNISQQAIIDEVKSVLSGSESNKDRSEKLTEALERFDKTESVVPEDLFSERDFEDKILVLWWMTDPLDAFALGLYGPDQSNYRYASGAQLGRSTSPLKVTSVAKDWVGSWALDGGHLRIDETWPDFEERRRDRG